MGSKPRLISFMGLTQILREAFPGALHNDKMLKKLEIFRELQISSSSLPLSCLVSYDAQMSPMEAVVLNAMMMESSMLNLRAHFLNRLPDLSPLVGLLTHLNLSFNDLWVSCNQYLVFFFLILTFSLHNSTINCLRVPLRVFSLNLRSTVGTFSIPFRVLIELKKTITWDNVLF